MYFNNIKIIDISTLLNNKYEYYAHLSQDEKERETLKEHTDRVLESFMDIFIKKSMENVFLNFEEYALKDFSSKSKEVFRELLINTITFHDLGKINPYFQTRKMDNKDVKKNERFAAFDSRHSIISSVFYIDNYIDRLKDIENKDEKKLLRCILLINAYIISKHHGDLDEFLKFLNLFDADCKGLDLIEILNSSYEDVYIHGFSLTRNKMMNVRKNTVNYLKKIDKNISLYLYTYEKLIFSLLVASDFYGTSEFMSNLKIKNFGSIESAFEFYDIYKDTDIYKSIRKYEKEGYINRSKDLQSEKNINVLRSEMFLDAENVLISNSDKNIYFLEAPTGSGKSNVSINLSFKLIDDNNNLNKIFYVYPFNTLIEQNLKTLQKTFGKEKDVLDKIAVINSISPIKMDDKSKNKEEEIDYKYYAKALLNKQFLNYPIVLTTHVSLFNTMFGSSKESSFGFHQLANSVIVLDEIQSYKNIIWSEIITFLDTFCKILNMKVIIMSATLPNLNTLIGNDTKSVDLILNRDKYFSNPLFKYRVKINYDLINAENSIDDLYAHVLNSIKSKKKILIEFIKKQSAYDFYKKLKKDSEDYIVEFISGDDNLIERKRILDKIDSEEVNLKGIILISTQVIEAGVDIDMDIGYKDISKLDSDEQFMGRINRSCKNEGVVYFFNLDKTNTIYNNDIRANREFSLLNEDMKKILTEKNFSEYYKPVLNQLKRDYNESFSDSNLEKFFIESVGVLNSTEVENRMKLIDDNNWNMSIYLSSVIEIGDGSVIDGEEIWYKYRNLLMNNSMKYAEKMVKLSQVRSKMNYFIYEIKKNDNFTYNDRIGELYFIKDGDKYFDDGKLNKKRFIQGIGDFI